jgi:hypothetical protein
MTTSKNSITGDVIQTKNITEGYRDNYDTIFRRPKISINPNTGEENEVKTKISGSGPSADVNDK